MSFDFLFSIFFIPPFHLQPSYVSCISLIKPHPRPLCLSSVFPFSSVTFLLFLSFTFLLQNINQVLFAPYNFFFISSSLRFPSLLVLLFSPKSFLEASVSFAPLLFFATSASVFFTSIPRLSSCSLRLLLLLLPLHLLLQHFIPFLYNRH